MSYSWFRSGTCTVANGSDVVRFQNAQLTTSPTKPVEGDAFTIDGTKFYETIFIGSDSAGEYIKLQQPYSGASASNAKYAIARFASGTQNAKLVAMATAAINQKQISLDDMEEWFTSASDTVDFSNPDGSISTITTYHKLTKEISAVGGNSAEISTVAANIVSIKNVSDNMPAVIDAKPQADRAKAEADRAKYEADKASLAAVSFSGMSQAQFEAIRAQNKERYAASGWVSFGNHESGKQVNECKPGLYTTLTTPNTLLIGKAGGVGGSKTDNASVHIDGVVFNLTNQFVLTLPSHPTSTQPERMDMYGLESEKVEISAASPNAYQGGLRGVGAAVNLFTATDQQKKDFFSANANTTYIGTDGKIYQWQLYKVSFAGTTDGVPSPSEQGYSLNAFGDLWLKEGKNLLYFGNVLRLNDGGYHPSFNPLGAAKFVGDTFWYNTAASITSKADCFDPAKLLAGSGSIASGKSGRPELGGRYYDAIYASGFGGVCRDMRYSANGVDSVDLAEADQRVKNSTYRGFEKPLFTRFYPNAFSGYFAAENEYNAVIKTGASGTGVNVPMYSSGLAFKDTIIMWNSVTNQMLYGVVSDANGYVRVRLLPSNLGQTSHQTGLFRNQTDLWYFAKVSEQPNSVGGSFLQTDVIANSQNILATTALANGWQGIKNSLSPNSSISAFKLSPRVLTAPSALRSTDNGNTWTAFTPTYDPVKKEVTLTNEPTNNIVLLQYIVFAKQTENAMNTEVYGGVDGLRDVTEFGGYYTPIWGGIFFESLLNKVAVSDTGGGGVSHLNLTRKLIRPDIFTMNPFSGETCYHTAISKPAPTNGSSGMKALGYNVNLNQQAFIQYAYTELKHNGTNWGDDDKIYIVDNQSTKTDLNGNTVLVGTAKLKEPIGWIKQKI